MAAIRALTMPKWGIEMREGKLAEWLVKEGQPFDKGQLIALIETDKITNEVEAEFASTLRRIVTAEGETKPVGALLAILADATVSDAEVEAFAAKFKAADTRTAASAGPRGPLASARAPTGGADRAISPAAQAQASHAGIDPSMLAGSGRGGRITRQDVDQAMRPSAHVVLRGPVDVDLRAADAYFASPLAKRLAVLHGVELSRVTGAGKHGRITKADVLALAGPAADGAARIVPMSAIRRVIARRLTEAKATIPHFYLRAEARIDAMLALRRAVSQAGGVKASINDFLVRAAALALMQSPDVNIQVHGDAIHHFDTADIAIAVASEKGLMTPIVRGAQAMSIAEIAEATRGLIAKAQAARLSMAELEGGTFTISNLGMFGVDQFDAIINPPQGAILAIGGVRRVFAEQAEGGGGFEGRIALSMSCDHRAIDGAAGAAFLQKLKALIEHPERLLQP